MSARTIPNFNICKRCNHFQNLDERNKELLENGYIDARYSRWWDTSTTNSEYYEDFICSFSDEKMGRLFYPKHKEKTSKFMINNNFDFPIEKCPYVLEHTLSNKTKKDRDICFGTF